MLKQLSEVNEVELKPFAYTTASKLTVISLVFLAISSTPQLQGRETDMVVSYHIIPYLQHCYSWVVMYSALHNVLHKYCNMDILGFY